MVCLEEDRELGFLVITLFPTDLGAKGSMNFEVEREAVDDSLMDITRLDPELEGLHKGSVQRMPSRIG